MSVRPITVRPISYFRSHTRECLQLVNSEMHHLLLTRHGTGQACIIPMQDTHVLWHLQDRPVRELEANLKSAYALWMNAKQKHEQWEGMLLHENTSGQWHKLRGV